MDQISNSKRAEEEKEKGKTEKPLRGLYVLYTVVSKEESHSRVLMILIVGMNLSVFLPLWEMRKKKHRNQLFIHLFESGEWGKETIAIILKEQMHKFNNSSVLQTPDWT